MLFSMLVPGDNFRVRENQFSESLWGASISDIKRKLKKKKKKGNWFLRISCVSDFSFYYFIATDLGKKKRITPCHSGNKRPNFNLRRKGEIRRQRAKNICRKNRLVLVQN